jgi:hypothetical protein
MMHTRHPSRLARSCLAVSRAFGEVLRYQRAEQPDLDRHKRWCVNLVGVTRSGEVRTSLPA